MSVTDLAIRHHLSDQALLASVTGAGWSDSAGFGRVDVAPLIPATGRPAGLDVDAFLVLVDHADDETQVAALEEALIDLRTNAPVLLSGSTLATLPRLADILGIHPGEWTRKHEIRLRPAIGVDPRRSEDLVVRDRLLLAEKVGDDVTVLVTASVGLRDHVVAAFDPGQNLGALTIGSFPETWRNRDVLRLVRHLVRALQGVPEPADVRVGMLGYGAIGHEHALAFEAVPGLRLVAVGDVNPARVALARTVAPDVRGHDDGEPLLEEEDVDLVVISTPPSSHAEWARRALLAGKHVVLEKPMALSVADCDEILGLADDQHRLVVVYQNRRFDPDFLTMRQLIVEGRIGEVFHLESFVGGYRHPCNLWHSDVEVSGGAVFDWGSHYLDQILELLPGTIHHVSAVNHKRRWHDVTNADHARVTLHYVDGVEAEFIHSDLAAASKPKWLVLGTEGAIVGHWRSERVIGRTPIGTLAEDRLAPADAPADLTLHAPDGSVTSLVVPLPLAEPFHRELADHLLRGLPMTVLPEHGRRVVAVMQAAEASADRAAAPVPVP